MRIQHGWRLAGRHELQLNDLVSEDNEDRLKPVFVIRRV